MRGKAIAALPLWPGLGVCVWSGGWVGRKRWGAELGGSIERSPLFCVSAFSPAPASSPHRACPPAAQRGEEEEEGEEKRVGG